ncbi:3'-5' exonuclease [Flammeovirga kamogawensis]|uniref:3'-5' exonuclease n=1 Tax=Flammeovirga kamogawensis TaxID=373891 RepID=A0ABX8H341_9BACT|nr:3'-5' exonuclease [Flammeovirga kamogawensis]MBB6460165.1 DNA polymerase-3 subunit epsilon [Flammeovirga kamogawensis]QWG09977.1 3'-5' exonuclease [Flammeovirga kamogawensis]TRX65485.1 3'-5' exonuclease [Flammeovirga kamogawensis]
MLHDQHIQTKAKRKDTIPQIKKDFIVLDTETTGLDAGVDEALQLSIINDEREILLSTYIKPKFRKTWPEAMAVNGITPEMVRDAPVYDFAMQDMINDIIEDKNVIIYNAPFDMAYLDLTNAKGVYCAMNVFSTEIKKEWNDKYNNYKWQRLSTAFNHFIDKLTLEDKILLDNAHDSLSDSFMTLFVWQKMMAEGFHKGKNYLADLD